MGVETSPSFTFSGGAPATYNPDSVYSGSPLWPLQQALRAGFVAATNSSGVQAEQIARTWPVRTQIEDMFGQWQVVTSLTTLRAAINSTIANLDLANDPTLSMFQAELLGLSEWSDALPS